MALENKISEVENELFEASEEMRKLTVERRNAEAEAQRISDIARVVLDGRAVCALQSSEGEAGVAGATVRGVPRGACGRFWPKCFSRETKVL